MAPNIGNHGITTAFRDIWEKKIRWDQQWTEPTQNMSFATYMIRRLLLQVHPPRARPNSVIKDQSWFATHPAPWISVSWPISTLHYWSGALNNITCLTDDDVKSRSEPKREYFSEVDKRKWRLREYVGGPKASISPDCGDYAVRIHGVGFPSLYGRNSRRYPPCEEGVHDLTPWQFDIEVKIGFQSTVLKVHQQMVYMAWSRRWPTRDKPSHHTLSPTGAPL